MTQPITDGKLKGLMGQLDDLHAILSKHIVYGHAMDVKSKGVHYVENTLMENAQAHVREAAVALGRIIVNRIGDK